MTLTHRILGTSPTEPPRLVVSGIHPTGTITISGSGQRIEFPATDAVWLMDNLLAVLLRSGQTGNKPEVPPLAVGKR